MFGGLALQDSQLFVTHGLGHGRVAALDPGTFERKLEFALLDERRRPCVASAIAVGPTFSIHAADPFGRAVRVYSIFGNPLRRLGAPVTDLLPVAPDRRGVLAEPSSVAVDERGHVYVASAGGPRVHAVQRFTAEGRFLGSYRAFGVACESFNAPRALALSKQHLFVADSGNGAVHVFRRAGSFRQVFSTATRHGERSYPVALALEEPDSLLVLDRGDRHELRRFLRGGEFREVVLPEVRLDAPVAVANAPGGPIFVLDLDGERLRAFQHDGSLVASLWLGSSELPGDEPDGEPEVQVGKSR